MAKPEDSMKGRGNEPRPRSLRRVGLREELVDELRERFSARTDGANHVVRVEHERRRIGSRRPSAWGSGRRSSPRHALRHVTRGRRPAACTFPVVVRVDTDDREGPIHVTLHERLQVGEFPHARTSPKPQKSMTVTLPS